MMNHTDGWMNGWMGQGTGVWAVAGLLLVVFLVLAIVRMSKK